MQTDNSDIKIFVSRRLNVDSVVPDNPLFVPVRCGAIYDECRESPYVGDNTDDNISQKRVSFCEFTVQYWAWKNIPSDYYGLCHYRRYLSFAEKRYRTGAHGLLIQPLLDENAMRRFGLLDEKTMRECITKYDLIVPCGAPVSIIFTQHGKARTVWDIWESHSGRFYPDNTIERMFKLIDELAPEYSYSAREYFSGALFVGYNCYVMRWELFDRLCRLQFSIMEAFERELAETGNSKKYVRAPAYIGEMLFGIFVHHVTKHEKHRCKELQLLMFEETRPVKNKLRRLGCITRHGLDHLLWKSTMALFPIGTERREAAKRIYMKITKWGR